MDPKKLEKILRTSKTYRLRPASKAERAFCAAMEDTGWKLVKRGWPDFLCFKPDGTGLMIVEVKKETVPLKKSQALILEVLAACGVPCFLWAPGSGFQRIGSK